MTILVIIEHDNENILPATFNAITAALKLEKPIDALVVGKDVQQISEAASKIKFISKIKNNDIFKYVVSHITSTYERSKIMGFPLTSLPKIKGN